ncbi:MAG: tetratricopeptide repeat protein, partial [Treponema sp.]|nr:tetratricopeptide repeat protein [Treponema sp.]
MRKHQWFGKAAVLEEALLASCAAMEGGGDLSPEEAAPKTAETFLDRGIAFAVRGEYDRAVADFSEAIDRAPDLRAAWMLRGRAWYAGASHVTGVGDNFS